MSPNLLDALLVSSTVVIPAAVFILAEALGNWRDRKAGR